MIRFSKEEWEEFLENIDFTDSEIEVIGLVRRGWFEIDIAAEIDKSVSTVKRRISSITLKIVAYILRSRELKTNYK